TCCECAQVNGDVNVSVVGETAVAFSVTGRFATLRVTHESDLCAAAAADDDGPIAVHATDASVAVPVAAPMFSWIGTSASRFVPMPTEIWPVVALVPMGPNAIFGGCTTCTLSVTGAMPVTPDVKEPLT